MNVLVIGAGFFGISAALELSKKHKVTLVEKNSEIMQNASKRNHSRIHFGYHYPRSIATAIQSLDGYDSFKETFKECISQDFKNYYMVAKRSHVTPHEYMRFCDAVGLAHFLESPPIDVNLDEIAFSALTNEPIFDFECAKKTSERRLKNSSVKLILNHEIKNKRDLCDYDIIINSSYFNINKTKRILGAKELKLNLQTVVIPIFEMKEDPIGLTVMDGDFCSIMPKGFEKNHFLLYHVKDSVIFRCQGYTVPLLWKIGKAALSHKWGKYIYDKFIIPIYIKKIFKNSQKYFPFLKNAKPIGYWQTIRALPINTDDERLSYIDVQRLNNQTIISVLSGKVSTCELTAQKISNLI